MSSSIPPTFYFDGIQYNSDFFKSSTDALTLDYANDNYLSRVGAPTSIASNTTFTGNTNFSSDVSFNYLSSPPHCSIPPINPNDLTNKAYVDAQAPLTAFQLFCNYTETYTTSTPTTYKRLSNTEVFTPTVVPFTISAIGDQFVVGFFNLINTLSLGNSIPPGNWTLNC